MALQNIEHVEQRVRSYWYADGLAELATGVAFVLLGAYFGLQEYFGEGSGIATGLQIGIALMILLDAYYVRRVVRALKMRLTYPRTGYVEYHADAGNVRVRRFATAAAGFAAAMALVVLYRSVHGLDMVVLATGVLVAFIFAALQLKSGAIKRFYVQSALSLALGVVLSISGFTQAYSLALFYGLLGIALALSGGWVLHRYLSENPWPVRADNG